MPNTPAPVVPAPVAPVPWLKFPPDRKIWAGGIAGLAAWIILSILGHYGIDVQAIAVSIVGPGAPDVQGLLAGLIGFLVAHFTTPSTQDVVQHVNNDIVAIAAATPGNGTTAEVVSEARSDQVSVQKAIAGQLPTDTVKQMVAAGMVAAKAVPTV